MGRHFKCGLITKKQVNLVSHGMCYTLKKKKKNMKKKNNHLSTYRVNLSRSVTEPHPCNVLPGQEDKSQVCTASHHPPHTTQNSQNYPLIKIYSFALPILCCKRTIMDHALINKQTNKKNRTTDTEAGRQTRKAADIN